MADIAQPVEPSSITQSQQQRPLHQLQPQDRAMSIGNTGTSPETQAARPNTATASTNPTASGSSSSLVQPSDPNYGGKEISEVLTSEHGVTTMINRLKMSINSAKEFALFLKKRSQLEEEHANGMKKLCHISNNTMRRPEHREGTWAQAYEDTMIVHDRMCENSLQFAASLHHMHEDLIEMAAIAEKSRKGWKQSGLSAEQRIHELEAAMKKSKAKYDQLAQDYERVKMGDSRGGSKGFFKSSKSAAQQEEELLHKVQTADQDYRSRVDAVLQERASVTSTARPDAVKALQDLVRECDAGLTLQLQKFASFNEKLLLSNGLTISPIKGQGSSGRSLREIASSVNNEKDARDFIMGQYKVLPPRTPEPKYERNPVLNPTATQPIHPGPMMGQQPTHHHGPGMGQASIHPMTTSGQQQPTLQGGAAIPGPQRMRQSSGAGSMQSPPGSSTGSPMPPTKIGAGGPGFGSSSQGPGPQRSLPQQQQQYDRNFSHENLMGNSQSTMSQQQQSGRNTAGSGARFNSGNLPSLQPGQGQSPQNQVVPQPVTQGPFPGHQQSQLLGQQSRGSSPLGAGQSSPRQKPMPFPNNALPANSQADSGPQSAQAAASRSVSPPSAPIAPPSRPVFGVSLERLYERDGIPVPMVVYRCIQAVDLFGLNVEGIYRLSGSQIHVQKLRMLFDTVGADGNSPDTDFRNPENFFHDVNSVAGLLKQFFRDLPDPVLTKAMYNEFIRAAKEEDDVTRRDKLHAAINNLPDPNYATLKALTLHLHRIMENSSANRMSSQNLAIVFGPTLLGSSPDSNNLADAAWHTRAIDTILQNTYQIFDED